MKTLPKLIKEADDWFSKYVRLRDSEPMNDEYVGTCITCTKYGTVAWRDETGKLRFTKGWNAGHFVSRGNDVIRFDETNVNLQCAMRCNKMNSGEFIKYKIALREKYGQEVPDELENLAEKTQYYKFDREELEQIIKDSKEQVKYYERNL
jgi:hypothetical protein